MNKKGGNETMWPRVIKIILVVLVIIGVIFVVYRIGLVQKFNNLFPDYLPQNFSDEELRGLGCDKAVAQIRLEGMYGFRHQVLYMVQSNQGTGIVWDYEKGKLYFQYGDKIFGEGNIVVGDIIKGVVKIKPEFLDENSETYLKYKYDSFHGTGLFATIEDLKLLDNSYKLENNNYLCKSDGQFEDYKEAMSCTEKCSIFNGVCKISASVGEISYGKLDCFNGECYVKENEYIQSNGELKIDEFSLVGNPGENDMNLLDKNEINLDNGVLRFVDIKASHNDSFCYILSSDKEVLFNGYNSKYDKMSVKVSQFNPSLEKSLQFIAWDNNNKKTIKRVKINVGALQYQDGVSLLDVVDFKNRITAAKVGSIFYVAVESIWFQGGGYNYRVTNLRMTKTDENSLSIEAEISAESGTTYGRVGNYEWKKLDCTWGWGSDLSINKIMPEKNGLKSAVLKECGL